ncbi:hypothetical protein [Streptomyces bauhiniae]
MLFGDLSEPETTPTFDVQPRPDGGATVAASAQVRADLTVTAHVVAPPAGAQAADPVVIREDDTSVADAVQDSGDDALEDLVDTAPATAQGQLLPEPVAGGLRCRPVPARRGFCAGTGVCAGGS